MIDIFKISLSIHELEQLFAFSKHKRTFPGDTISHYISNKLIDKGLAKRVKGDFVITDAGKKYIEKIKNYI